MKLRAREVTVVQNLGSNRSSHRRILKLDQDYHIEVDGFVIMVRPADGADHNLSKRWPDKCIVHLIVVFGLVNKVFFKKLLHLHVRLEVCTPPRVPVLISKSQLIR